MSVLARELVRLEREEQRCLQDATRLRSRLLALLTFDTAGELARLGESGAGLDQQTALAELQLCVRRTVELQAERRLLLAEGRG